MTSVKGREGETNCLFITNERQNESMKRHFLSVAVVLGLAGSMLCTSCIGSFALTNKLLGWNQQIGNKFVNELVFFAFWIIPVYEVTALADVVVLNSVEFWSGRNPVTASTKVIDGQDGKYLVESDSKGYTITSINDGSKVRLAFEENDNSWSVVTDEGSYKFMTMVDDNHVNMITPDGSFRQVELSAQGLTAYRAAAAGALYASR